MTSLTEEVGNLTAALILTCLVDLVVSQSTDKGTDVSQKSQNTHESRKPKVAYPELPVIDSPQCSDIPLGNRRDCWPGSGLTEHKCVEKGCCWQPYMGSTPGLGGIPWCFYPSDYQGYIVQSLQTTANGMSVTLKLSQPSGWPNDIENVALDVTYDSTDRLRFKLYDPNNARYEVPLPLYGKSGHVTAIDVDYIVDIPANGTFYIKVTRKSTGKVVFNTQDASPLVFADQFLQIGTKLSTQYIYGLGEHRSPFLVSTNWTQLALWNRDQPPKRKTNLYGSHPFYLNVEDDRHSHGVFLLNSNAMEIEVQPTPALTYRTTGGLLDFYIFTGPTPDEVVQQYTALIGRPFMPPYWALGFHLCRWDYGGIDGLKKVIQRMRDANMPYDVQWNDIDYMRHHLDWTYDYGNYTELPDVVADIHDHGQHYIMIVDPGISNTQKSGSYPAYDEGIAKDIFIKKPDGSGPIVGLVWPGTTAFPDFFHPNTTAYWTDLAQSFHKEIPFDGLWTDMNEPSNFVTGSIIGCPDNNLENPPFVPPVLDGKTLRSRTLCASSKQYLSEHYNLHNMYGYSESVATKSALNKIKGNERSIVISRSTFPGSGVVAGHWTGDNTASWDDAYWSIPAILNFNMFGIPLVGADICGFEGNTNPEMCARWMQLGAFYPFMRNHNSIGMKDQDPAVFDQATQTIMRDALNLRYTLLPYLYTLFYRSHVDGTPIIRPLFYQYPVSDYNITYMVDSQFLWGTALLITPVTSQSTTIGLGYLPQDRWYDWFNQSYIDAPGGYINFDLPAEHINLQIRGGSIIPLQTPAVTTTLARKNKFTILAALSTTGTASGELYWDDGESRDSIFWKKYNLISFNISKSTLSSTVLNAGYVSEPMVLGEARIVGVEVAPTSVTLDDKVLPVADYTYTNKVWPGTTTFPDFFHPNTTSYWTDLAQSFHKEIPFDGLWTDMNEPSNFVTGSIIGCPDNNLENPPFVPPVLDGKTLRSRTLCASSKQYLSEHYNLHNMYGYSESVATKSALNKIKGNERSIVISRSTFPGSGVVAGHWTGDNTASWDDAYWSIPAILNFNMFGIPLVGADICGFEGNTNPEMCARWMQLGAFYPFMRNHNSIGMKDQDPAVFDQATQTIMRDALNLRYTLLPYLYTLFYRSHVDGTPIIRPLFYQYPVSDYNITYMVDSQFLWGTALLITPVTSQSTTIGLGYLPQDRWYDWFNQSYIDASGGYINFDLPAEHINLQIRGGSIIPLQTPAVTTTLARKNKFTILAALSPTGTASGELYWDDGESRDSIFWKKYNLISFNISKSTLSSTVLNAGYVSEPMVLGEARIVGVEVAPTSVTLDDKVLPVADYTYTNKTLVVQNLSTNLLKSLAISWLV